jgi:uncharacterized protein
MRVKIEEIQLPGLELNEPIEPKVFSEAFEAADGFSLVRSTHLVATFKKVSGRVHVLGGFTATVKCPCKRCLKDQVVEVPVDFSLRMIEEKPRHDDAVEEVVAEGGNKRKRRSKKQKKEDDDAAEVAASFELDEVDAEPFDGKTIELDPIIREQVLLALPLSVLCRDECKGLCAVCGTDLNEQDCGHAGKKEVDVRLAKLKDIKLKN